MEAEISKIESIGETIGNSLNEKILKLTSINNGFNQHLLEKLKLLKKLAEEIRDFREKNADELKNTKNNLALVTGSLNQTKQELKLTQTALEQAKRTLSTIQQDLLTTTEDQKRLNSEIADLNAKIAQTESDHKQQIANITNQKEDERLQQREQLQKEFDERIANLNREKTEIERQLDETNRLQAESQQKIAAFESEQQSLITRLGVVNELLVKQLSMINTVIDEPNFDEYNTLLESIESALRGVLDGINQAVSSSTSSSNSGTTDKVDPNYNIDTNYKNLLDQYNQRKNIQDFAKYLIPKIQSNQRTLYEREKNRLIQRLFEVKDAESYPEIKEKIKELLRENGIIIPSIYNSNGGKRKRKTMKKKHRKSRKLMKGGYTYNKNDKLDKASSDVSNSLNSSSGSNSNTNKRSRRRSSRPRSRTKRRSIK